MDLLDYLRLFRRRWALVLACTVVAGLAAWFTTPDRPANDTVTYAASHQLLRDSSAATPQALATVSLFVKTGEVPQRVAERLDFEGEPALLAGGVTLEPDDAVGTLEITARGSSPQQAAERANAFAEETLALLGETAQESQEETLARVNERLATLQAEIDSLNDRVAGETVAGSQPGVLDAERDAKLRQYGAALDQQQQLLNAPPPSAGYVTLQEALPDLATAEDGGFSAPRSRPARTGLAAVVGLFLGLVAVLVLERLDTRLHEIGEVAEAFGLPVIAEVPIAPKSARRRVALDLDPLSGLSESFRTLRSAVMLTPVTVMGLKAGLEGSLGSEPQVVLVTSPAPGDGKTTTVANLAVAIAETGRRVLVLGCDFRRPEVHQFFDRSVSPGVADVLDGSAPALSDVVVPTPVPGVSLAPSGASLKNLGDVAALGREMVEEARTLADVVIIDTPPILATNDASELIPACDAVVVVARMAKTTEDGARRTRFLLDRLGAPVSGVVAVGASGGVDAYASYYTSAGTSLAGDASEPGRGGAGTGVEAGSRRARRAQRKATSEPEAPRHLADRGAADFS